MLVLLVMMSAAASCTSTPQVRHAMPQNAVSKSPGGADEQRGIVVTHDLGLDHTIQVHRSKNDAPQELHDGDTVVEGERFHAIVQTSEDAYLYLAFCAHHRLAVYPSQRGIRTRAGERMVVPPPGGELVFDGDPGVEVLYVILSRAELSIKDPHLAAALAAQRPSNMPVDCGASLDAELAKPSHETDRTKTPEPHSTNLLRGTRVRKEQTPSTHARNGHRPTDAAPTPPDHKPPALSTTMGGPAVPGYERGLEQNPGDIVWYYAEGATGPADVVAADEDGIAVVRHAFTHVAQTSSR
jgi:hypothetical protein